MAVLVHVERTPVETRIVRLTIEMLSLRIPLVSFGIWDQESLGGVGVVQYHGATESRR